MKSWIFIIFLNWNECWKMKNQEMAETGKTARLPVCETYVLVLLKNKEEEVLQIAAHGWWFPGTKLTPRPSPFLQPILWISSGIHHIKMTLLLTTGSIPPLGRQESEQEELLRAVGCWLLVDAQSSSTGWELGGDPSWIWGWRIHTTALTTEIFVISALGGVLHPERVERSPPSLPSPVLRVFNPNQQSKFLRISCQGSALQRMLINALLKGVKDKNKGTVEGQECRMWCWRGCWETEIQKLLCSGRTFGLCKV